MKKQSSQAGVTATNRISVAWPGFAKNLADVLARMEEDQFLILSVKQSNRFVQFAAQGSFGMRIETTSNHYLTKPERLNRKQVTALTELGWHDPTGSPSKSTPEKNPDGSPNFYCEFKPGVNFESLANLAVRTLTEIMRVPHPGSLEYEALDTVGSDFSFPELGLRDATQTQSSNSGTGLSKKLLATLKTMTGDRTIKFDRDGDIAIRYGNALTFTCLSGDLAHVCFYAPILQDVEESPELFERLNDLNANERSTQFVFKNGVIYGLADVPAQPYVNDHVVQVYERFCVVVDGLDSLLQEEFGGETAFEESMPSLVRH